MSDIETKNDANEEIKDETEPLEQQILVQPNATYATTQSTCAFFKSLIQKFG